MQKFISRLIRFFLIGLIPLIIISVLYIYLDPFKVLKHYNDFSNPYVISNRDYNSTTMFINNKRKNKYNSFILGSSRTLAFKPNSWRKYLSEKDNPFMFDASAESIYGIYTKLKYLDSTNVKIKNALILLCRDCTFKCLTNSKGHLFIKHPATSGENKFVFQFEFFKAYLNPNFLLSLYYYKIIGVYKPFMAGYIENRKITFDSITNEILLDQEIEITQNPTAYYAKKKEEFYERNGEKMDSTPIINNNAKFMVMEIKRILEKNKTNYKVVLSPLYEQIKFNSEDLLFLKNEFGKNLYDFTGKNKFTDEITNYYEKSHFRPMVGDSILEIIYNHTL